MTSTLSDSGRSSIASIRRAWIVTVESGGENFTAFDSRL